VIDKEEGEVEIVVGECVVVHTGSGVVGVRAIGAVYERLDGVACEKK